MKKNIFEKRVNILPYDYPSLLDFKDAIRHSYWIHTEYNFTTDVNDFKIKISNVEREVIKRTMLAIAQIEVSVKTFWADLYKRMPITEIGDVGMTFAECHTEGTEILTSDGWKDFRDITIDSNILQYHMDNNKISITKPNKIVNEYYSGKIYELQNQTYSAKLTPNHRILYFNKKNELVEKQIKDIKSFHSEMKLPFTGTKIGTVNNLTDFERLKIALQADGSKRFWKNNDDKKIPRGTATNSITYEITVKKTRKKERLQKLIKKLNFNYREFKVNRPGYIKYEIDIPNKICSDLKTFDWVDLSDKSSLWCEEFIQELAEWDGTRLENIGNSKNCLIKYSTTVKKCADKVQAIGICAGYRCNLNRYTDNRKETYKDSFVISFNKAPKLSSTTTKTIEDDYQGNIYCVNVPSGCIITRYNNKVLISGNSEVRHKDAYAQLLKVLGLENEFKNVIEIPAIKDRITYLNKYLSGARSRNNKMYTKSVLLFSLFIEHVSLFSQFLIMMSFNKEKNLFKGISNVVEATSKEEEIHGNFGSTLINIIKKENPEWFDQEFEDLITSACKKAYKAEVKILDWIFEHGELEFLSKETIKQFIQNRFNNSLRRIGMQPVFEANEEEVEKTKWFDVEILSTKEGDFFYKKQIDYNKKSKSITEDDLF